MQAGCWFDDCSFYEIQRRLILSSACD